MKFSESLQERLLEIERSLWTNNAAIYAARLRDDAVFVFAETGLIDKSTAIHAIEKENREGRRWADVQFFDVRAVEPTPELALLTYRASAKWAHEPGVYSTLATSMYVREGGDLKLAFHQQTPLVATEPQETRRPNGAVAVRAAAFGALAVGATAFGALAIGSLAVGALAVGRARVRSLTIDELDVRRLRLGEQAL
jgi:hypothetical protein